MDANLGKIEHFVVLMMENRSFDHMLGYLKADGVDDEVDGLDPKEHGNAWPDTGRFEPVAPIGERVFHHKIQDPGHSADDVAEQLKDRNGGFLRNYVKVLERRKATWRKDGKRVPPDRELPPEAILGYQRAEQVPVYDYVARNFVVCDRWFSSVPGPTWPNRLFATTGGIANLAKNAPDVSRPLRKLVGNAPIYDGTAFTAFLHRDQWRWYSFDPATLRLIDSAYRPGGKADRYSDPNFAYFNRRTLLEPHTFLDDAEHGRLPDVSWIDPNFVDFRLLGPPGSNDDHPPSRILLGQKLVLEILVALARNPEVWKKTLLLVTYDEHGGFYDHVPPADFPVLGERSGSGRPRPTYGVRVPALVVSPWADAGVSHTVFDHASIVKTILLHAADERGRDEGFGRMGARTRAANDLGPLLARSTPREPPLRDLETLVDRVRAREQEHYERGLLEQATAAEKGYDVMTDLQAEIVAAASLLRRVIPPGKP
jgi:phospholipase C